MLTAVTTEVAHSIILAIVTSSFAVLTAVLVTTIQVRSRVNGRLTRIEERLDALEDAEG